MRIRSVIITAVAGVAFMGASANVASANTPPAPQCCGGIKSSPTTQPPKPGDKFNQPTTTTTMKPIKANPVDPNPDPKPNVEGPGDVKAPEKDPVVDPKPQDGPKGPGDKIAPKPKDDGIDPGEYGNGSGSEPDGGKGVELGGGGDKGQAVDNNTGGGTTSDSDNGVEVLNTSADSETDDSADESTETAAREDSEEGSNTAAFLMIFFALLTAGGIGLVVARMRRDDEDAETI